MAWTKTKTEIVVGLGVLLAAGITTVSIIKIRAYQANRDSWRVPDLSWEMVAQAAPQVRIVPTKFKAPVFAQWDAGSGKWGGVRVSVAGIVRAAYHGWYPGRILFPAGKPNELYDFISTLPQGTEEALQRELKNKLGLVGRREIRDMDVLVLKVRSSGASGLQPPIIGNMTDFMWFKGGIGHYYCGDQPLSTDPPAPAHGLTKYLEMRLHMPVIDETGLPEHFNIDITWKQQGWQNYDALKKAVLDQLGLELIPDHRPVEMLVVEKLKN
jgi:uncharacterized protein (TIGR03435 family)